MHGRKLQKKQANKENAMNVYDHMVNSDEMIASRSGIARSARNI